MSKTKVNHNTMLQAFRNVMRHNFNIKGEQADVSQSHTFWNLIGVKYDDPVVIWANTSTDGKWELPEDVAAKVEALATPYYATMLKIIELRKNEAGQK